MSRYASKIQSNYDSIITPQACLTCSGNCLRTCEGTCYGDCKGTCKGGCATNCKGGCTGLNNKL